MNNTQLVNDGLSLMTQINEHDLIAVGDTAVSHRLHQTAQLTATLIAQRQAGRDIARADMVKLFQKIDRYFSDSDLRDICFRLNMDDEDFGASGKRDKARELVVMMDRHGRLPDLTAIAAELRPKVNWQDSSQQSGGADITAKLNIAVVVDIARPTVRDVARYLDDIEMDANFLLLQNTDADRQLSADGKWNAYISAFAQTMDSVKHRFSGARLHFFLSAPGALIFGLGCIWGTVDEAEVYHWQQGRYYPVISISRGLRSQ